MNTNLFEVLNFISDATIILRPLLILPLVLLISFLFLFSFLAKKKSLCFGIQDAIALLIYW